MNNLVFFNQTDHISKSFIELFPFITVSVLLMGAFLIPILKKKVSVYKANFILVISVLLMNIVNLAYVANHGSYFFRFGHFDKPYSIVFHVGMIESIIALLFSFVILMVHWYSFYSLEREIKENRVAFFYILSSILLASLLGIVYTYDLFNGFVFLELSTLAACGIIVVKDKKSNLNSALKYLILSSLGSGLVLMGIAFVYSISGHLSMDFVNDSLMANMDGKSNLILISLILFIIGLGIKGAMFPLHIWLPDAHTSAPSPSSAVLSSIVIKAPIIFLIKILYVVFGFEIVNGSYAFELLLIFGSLGMIMGSLFARSQKEIKKMIAYSSVAQMGYIFFAIGLGNSLGLAMAIYHIIAHALTKSTLFLAVGSFIEQTGNKKIDGFRGIGKEMPLTLALFSLGALSMVGIPVLPGFISKWNLALAAIETGKIYLLIIILGSSLLNAVYYFPIIINGYFGEDNLDGKVFKSKSKPIKELIPLVILSISLVLAGFLSGVIIDAIKIGLY